MPIGPRAATARRRSGSRCPSRSSRHCCRSRRRPRCRHQSPPRGRRHGPRRLRRRHPPSRRPRSSWWHHPPCRLRRPPNVRRRPRKPQRHRAHPQPFARTPFHRLPSPGDSQPGSGSDGGPAAPSSGGAAAAVQVAFADEGGGPGAMALGAFASFTGSTVFAVPAAVLGGPGPADPAVGAAPGARHRHVDPRGAPPSRSRFRGGLTAQPSGVAASHSSRNLRTSARKKPTWAPSSTR